MSDSYHPDEVKLRRVHEGCDKKVCRICIILAEVSELREKVQWYQNRSLQASVDEQSTAAKTDHVINDLQGTARSTSTSLPSEVKQ